MGMRRSSCRNASRSSSASSPESKIRDLQFLCFIGFFFFFPISLCNFCAVFSFPYDFDAISMFVNHGEYRALEISRSNTNNERSIASEDLLSALQGVGLSDYSHALGLYLQRYREVISLFTVLFQFYCSSSFLR